jgi:pimeloyl-ACP methyl ester carboxylesterase
MKKLLFLAMCACVLSGFVYGVDYDNPNNKKVSDITYFFKPPETNKVNKSADEKRNEEIAALFNGKRVYYFDGFDFAGYKSSDPSLDDLTDAEVNAINNGVYNPSWISYKTGPTYRVTRATGPYSIIGHSQGGLRSLGYITKLKAKHGVSKVNNIDAVITISGIEQGLKALEGGLGAFKRRASEKINIIGNGLRAAAGIFDIFGYIDYLIPRDKLASAFNVIIALIPKQHRPYYLEAWKSTNASRVPQIEGMIPRSKYITNNVATAVDNSYKVKTGRKLSIEWRTKKVLFVTIGYVWIGYVDVYTYYTSTEAAPKFDPKVPVGFIVGEEHSITSMNKDAEPTVKKVLKGFEIGFGVVEGIHIVKCIGIIGLFSNSPAYAVDAERAMRFCRNFDSEMYDVIGSLEGDGLAAKGNQYIPKTYAHPGTGVTKTKLTNPVLGGDPKGYVGLKKNHVSIVQDIDAFRRASGMVSEAEFERKKQGLR